MNYLLPYIFAVLLISGLFFGLAPVAKKIGLVDYPDERKQHETPTPLIGGLCIVIGLLLSLLLFDIPYGQLRILFFCIGIITIIGVLDDHNDIPIYAKFLVQVFVSVVLVLGDNLIVRNIGDIWAANAYQGLGPLSIPVTLVGIVGVINAFNLIDGHDGLAGFSALSGISSLLILYHFSGAVVPLDHWALLSLLAIIVAVFLVFNVGLFRGWPKIFLGDAGSMLLGLIFAYFLIRMTQPASDSSFVFSPVVAPWLIGLPLLDMFRVIIKRTVSGRSPLSGDRQHVHHILLHFGFSRVSTLLILAAMQLVLCTVGVLSALYHLPDWLLFWNCIVLLFFYYRTLEKLAA